MRKTLFVAAIAVPLALAATAEAATALSPDLSHYAFVAADSNHDGVLDEAEIAADTAKAFVGRDANHDGFIEPGELAGHDEAAFAAIDTNHDGKLSFEEVRAAKLKQFETADKDDNGLVTEAQADAVAGK